MPKYEYQHRIDARRSHTTSVPLSGINWNNATPGPGPGGGGGDSDLSIEKIGTSLFDTKKGRRYLTAETWLAQPAHADEGHKTLYFTGGLPAPAGTEIILSERGIGEEVVTVTSYEGPQANGQFLIRVDRGPIPLLFDAYKCRAYVRTNYIRMFSTDEPPVLMFIPGRNEWEAQTIIGTFEKTPTHFREKFYSFERWDTDIYGVVGHEGRFRDRVVTNDIEVMNDANVRHTLTAMPLGKSSGAVLGDTPVGVGLTAQDEEGFPFFYAVALDDGSGVPGSEIVIQREKEKAFHYQANGDWSIDMGTLRVDKAKNGLILPAALTSQKSLTVQPSVVLPDGRHYAEIQVGSSIIQSTIQSETFSGDISFELGKEYECVALHTEFNFPAGSLIEYRIYFVEEGGNDGFFAARLDINGTVVDTQQVTINGSAASVVALYKTKTAIPVGSDIRIKGSYTGKNVIAFTKASIVNNKLSIKDAP